MYYIVEKQNQLNYLKHYEGQDCFINIISLNDNFHPFLTDISLIYYRPLSSHKGYILCIDHSESLSLKKQNIFDLLKQHPNIYVLDKKYHLYFTQELNLVDINFNIINKNENPIFCEDVETECHKFFNNKFYTSNVINKIIPISKHYEKFEIIFNKVSKYFYNHNNEYFNDLSNIFFNLEKNGIKLNLYEFDKFYEVENKMFSIKDSTFYSKFNLYNLTLRPTNSFNHVNLSAIPKTKQRKAFIPKNDLLVEFDIDGYHPRIVGELIGYPIDKNESIHKQLGQLYFNKAEISSEDYTASKKLTFRQLYGGVQKQYLYIEFFNKTQNFINELWKRFIQEKQIILPGGKTINYSENLNPNKIFNYIIQSFETYNNVQMLKEMLPLFEGKKSQIILYTYDSFLVDFDKNEKELYFQIKDILNKKYMCKISSGKTYNFSKN